MTQIYREFEGKFSVKLKQHNVEKLLIKINEASQLRPGATVLITSDKEGQKVEALVNESQIKKEMSFYNIYGDTAYLHYPVYPNLIYQLSLNEDQPQP